MQTNAAISSRAYTHRRLPDLIPSIYWAYRLFGGAWEKVVWAAEPHSMRASLQHWIRLRRRLGRLPTTDEMAQAGVSLEPVKRIYTTRSQLNEFLNDIARLDDKMSQTALPNSAARGPELGGSNGVTQAAQPA